MSDALRKTAGYAGIYAIGGLLNRGVSFIMLPIYTRFLTPTDYGVLELLLQTIDVVSIFTGLGLLNGLHKFYYKYDDEKQKREVVSTLFVLVVACYAVACTIGALASPWISNLVFDSLDKTYFTRLTFLNLFLSFLVFVPMGYLQARQLPIVFVTMSCCKLLCQVGLNLLFVVHLEMGVVGVLYSQTIALTLVGGGLSIYTFRRVGFNIARDKARELFLFGYPFVFNGFAAFITTYSDRYFLDHYQDTATVGLYSLGYKFGFLLMFLPVGPIFRIWNVQRFELAKEDNYVEVFNRFLIWFTLVVSGAALGIALLVRDLLRTMSAPEFHGAWVIVPVVLVAYVFQGFTNYFNFGIYHAGKSRHMAIGTGFAAIVILALSFWWIPSYGALGAACATLVSFAVRLGYIYVASQKSWPIDYRLRRPLAIGATAIGVFLVWLGLTTRIDLFDSRLYSIPLSVALLVSFPLIVTAAGILPEADRGLLRELVRAPGATLARIKGGG